jgi:hypothetical protein
VYMHYPNATARVGRGRVIRPHAPSGSASTIRLLDTFATSSAAFASAAVRREQASASTRAVAARQPTDANRAAEMEESSSPQMLIEIIVRCMLMIMSATEAG